MNKFQTKRFNSVSFYKIKDLNDFLKSINYLVFKKIIDLNINFLKETITLDPLNSTSFVELFQNFCQKYYSLKINPKFFEKDLNVHNFVIIYDLKRCIGCFSCVLSCNFSWKISSNSKSKLIDYDIAQKNIFYKFINSKEFTLNSDVAENCPLRSIKIVSLQKFIID